jgi:WD40 repeat protein
LAIGSEKEMKSPIQFILSLCVVLFVAAVCWAQKPELVVQTGHSNTVYAIAFSPDGKLLASGDYSSAIKIWEVGTGRELRTLTGHAEAISALAFSRDGKTLASGSVDYTIKLWDLVTGREIRTFTGHALVIFSVVFTPDGGTLISSSEDKTIRLWEVATGRELQRITDPLGVRRVAMSPDGALLASQTSDVHTIKLWDRTTGQELRALKGHTDSVSSVAFSPDGKALASRSQNTIKLWEVNTGRELRTMNGPSGSFTSLAFGPDGKMLAAGASNGTITLWDVSSGQELRTLSGHRSRVDSVAFSLDGQTLGSSDRDGKIKLWEPATGREVRTLDPRAFPIGSVAISKDGTTVVSGNAGRTIKVWDLETRRELRTFTGHAEGIRSVALTTDGKTLASTDKAGTVKLWNVATGRELHTLGHSGPVSAVVFSGDDRTVVGAGERGKIKLWDVNTGQELRTIHAPESLIRLLELSADGTMLARVGSGGRIELFDVTTGRELRTLTGHSKTIDSLAFSSDGKILASSSEDNSIKLWDVATGRELRTFRGHTAHSLVLSRDGKLLASGGHDYAIKLWDVATIKLWDVATGRELHTLTGHSYDVTSVKFSGDDKFLISGSADATTKLWRVETGALLATLIALDDRDWAVVTPDGRFDASPNAQKLMHWMVGTEPIELEQLKERYYEPGLLAKLTGFNKEPLRDVSALMDVKLFPTVDYQLAGPKSTSLEIKLTNRGGGIGPVQVFVNDKELIVDARPPGFNPNQAQANLTVDLSGAAVILGQVNEVRVVARNQEGYLSSRGTKLVWTPAGTGGVEPPDLYAIVVGTSTYASPTLELRYAAKDARDMARALELGAKRLFGVEQVHLHLLSTDKNNPRAIAPTKSNISKAFEQVAKARPQDIFVVYFAGHGVTLQQGRDAYLYLTQEARTTDSAVLADPGVREQTTISSEELVEWIKRVPALKQVMILDTCAAGAAAGKLVEQRNVSGDQIRAIERLKDRTGFHVLMGSAADAVSYEASQYGQGVLTYALLQGMRGAALREEEYVDVQKLFQYAADEVPQLARNIGGLQRPLVAAPRGTSFDVGRIGRDEKALIPVTTIKPMILRPLLLNAEEQADTLDLIRELRKRLREESYVLVRGSGREPLVIYVDEDELPGAIRPSGTYTITGDRVRVTMVLRRDGQRIATLPVVEGSKNDVAGLIDKIMKAISVAISGPLR